ncbi:MAG: alanine dehydrogenase [Candidatus Adiutrix sp.]|jgi:alanine dehydrogenase|nr:alanine dehydrogenase [Candidatus Adiutrix sp.]
MKIGCPREIKNHENRVGLTPNAACAYVQAGHEVLVESGAGLGSGLSDQEYVAAGAQILPGPAEVWGAAEMIVKVKEPLEPEYPLMRPGQLVYAYFHFAADESLFRACLERRIVALAYETVQEGRALPLLKPMSEVAGRMACLMGAFYISSPQGGPGLLPMGVTGVAPAEVLILGGGVVGTNAAHIAAGLNANVVLLDISLARLEYLDEIMPANVLSLYNDPVTLETRLKTADIIIGAVLIPGARAPRLIRREHLKLMKPGSVMVDVAIDQGGCFETSRPTTHSRPTFVVDEVIHYCVANMPGAYARTSTFALSNATVSYGLKLAAEGVEKACRESEALRLGLNMYQGRITCKPVAEAFGRLDIYAPAAEVIA